MKTYKNMTPESFKFYLNNNIDKITDISWYGGYEYFDTPEDMKCFICERFDNDFDWLKYHWKDDCIRFIEYVSDGKISVMIRDHNSDHGITDINDCDSFDGIIAPW